MKDVSIILVSYNTKDLTRNCLNSIYKNTKDIDFEIFVVDNNSKDASIEMLEQEFPNVKLIKNAKNQGFGAANNIAIKQSNAKYIFCLNTDTLLSDNSIKQLYDFMENHPEVGACGGQLLNEKGETITFGGKFPSMKGLIFKMFSLDKVFKEYYNNNCRISLHDISVLPDFISGAALFLRKKVLDSVGYFDETFFLYYEETDLCKRINLAGYDIYFLPYIKIFHLESKSPIKTINQLKINARSQCYYYRKHVGLIAFLILKIYNCLIILLHHIKTEEK